jgi:hypothetical protein
MRIQGTTPTGKLTKGRHHLVNRVGGGSVSRENSTPLTANLECDDGTFITVSLAEYEMLKKWFDRAN